MKRHHFGLVVASALAVSTCCALALTLVPAFPSFPSRLLGGSIIGSTATILVFGLVTSPAGARLRWLFWLQLGLVALLTQLAYLRAVPAAWILDWPGADKVGHLLFFGVLALSLDRWLRCRDCVLGSGRLRLPWALLIAAAGAGVEEALQSLSPARSADPLDLACDVAGMVLLIAFFRHASRRVGAQRSWDRTSTPS